LSRGIELDNAVMAGFADVTFAVHLCRGNQEGRWLVEGDYEPFARPIFQRIGATRLLLEYDDDRSGSFAPLRHATTGVAKMPPTNPTSSVITEQLTRALGEAVVRIWSNLPQEVQNHLFQEAVTSQGESIRSQLAVFLHDKHSRTADRLGKPREMPEPDSLGG
jgi:hypothetical protein